MGTGRASGTVRNGLTRRIVGFGASGGAMAVALIMALSPVAAAAGHTYHAPYAGAVSQTSTYTSQSGCATGALTSPVNWSSTTGVLMLTAKTSAKSCGTQLAGVGGYSYGYVQGGLEVAIPIKVATSAAHSISVNWKLHGSATEAMSPGTCTLSTTASYQSCYVSAYLSAYAGAYLVDTTNGSYFYQTNYWSFYNDSYNDTYCYSSTCYNSSGSFGYGTLGGNVSFFINGTLNKLDSYAILTYFYGYAQSYVSSYQATLTGASASASIVLAGGSNKATLSTIVVT